MCCYYLIHLYSLSLHITMIYSIRRQQANNREACFAWKRPGTFRREGTVQQGKLVEKILNLPRTLEIQFSVMCSEY